MAQPNLAVIADSLHTLSDQVALVPNMPGLGALQQHVANLDQRVGALDQHVGALDQRVGALEQRVGALDRRVTDNHRVLLETINTNQRLVLEQMQNMYTQMQNNHTQMQNNHTQMQQNHLSLSRQLTQLQNEHNLQPLRLYNSGLSETAPLRYPPVLNVRHPLPLSRLDLNGMSSNQCIQAATLLELPPLPPGTLIASRRRQIAEYLGAPSPF
ncbi:hypothetical protein MMC31_004536 [Peltigera leucophlebia]|nr:hypothetical protein [Peltigera leucophlebia]